MFLRVILCFCFLIGCLNGLLSQSKKDSLLSELATAKNDTSKVWLLHDVAVQYHRISIDSMIYYYEQALELARELDFLEGELSACFRLCRRYQYKGEKEKERILLNYALQLAKRVNSDVWLSQFQLQLGKLHFREVKYDSAYLAYAEAERLNIETDRAGHNWVVNYNLHELFEAQSDEEKAISYLDKAYEISKARGIRKDFGWILFKRTSYYYHKKDYDRFSAAQEEYLQFLMERSTSLDSPHKFLFAFADQDISQTIADVEAMIPYHKRRNQDLSLAETYHYLGGLKKQSGDLEGAIIAYNNAIPVAQGLAYKTLESSCYKSIYEIYESKNDFVTAYPFMKKHHTVIDSLNSAEVRKNLSALEVKYEAAKKDKELANNELTLQKSAQAKSTFILIAITGGLLAFVAYWLIFFKNKTNNRLSSQKEVIEKALGEKEILLKEIHHRVKNNLQVISSLLNWQSKFIEDNKALKSMQEGRNRVQSMALIHQNLYQTENLTGVEVSDYIEKLGASLFNSYNIKKEKVTFSSNVEPLNLDVDTLIPLGLILNELISNALKHAFPEDREGEIQVSLQKQEESLLLEVKDDGIGMESYDNKGLKDSFGHKLIEAFAEKLKAKLLVDSSYGTTVKILIQNFKIV
ncbi:MAG: sensor histidine kinase [Bacteroidota bacterium]